MIEIEIEISWLLARSRIVYSNSHAREIEIARDSDIHLLYADR